MFIVLHVGILYIVAPLVKAKNLDTIDPFLEFLMQPLRHNVMPEELAKAYDLYSKILVRHCQFRMFNKEDAEEIVQDTFMNVYEYMRRGNTVENIRVFLYTVTNNLIVDRVRQNKMKREKQVSLDELTEKGFDIGAEHDLAKAIDQKMHAKAILDAVKKMEKADYELLVMRYIDGLMPTDIASVTGHSPNAISVKLHRALSKASTSLAV